MDIINRTENSLLGEIICFADKEGNPWFWGKQVMLRLLSEKEYNVTVGLDLYCFDKDFETGYWTKEEADTIIKNVYDCYNMFLCDCKDMDDIFIRTFNEDKDEWDIEAEINTKEDLYSKVQVQKVDIVKQSYIINFLLEEEEWSLVKVCSNEFPAYFQLSPTEEVKFAEMTY